MTSRFLFLAVGWVAAAVSRVTWLDWWTGLGRKVKRLPLESDTVESHRQPSSTNKNVNLDINSQSQTANGLLASWHCCMLFYFPYLMLLEVRGTYRTNIQAVVGYPPFGGWRREAISLSFPHGDWQNSLACDHSPSKTSTKIRNKTRLSTLSISTQYRTWSLSYNKTTEGDQGEMDWRRNQSITVCRW